MLCYNDNTWGAIWEGLPFPPAAPRTPPFPFEAPLLVQLAASRSAPALVFAGEPGENGSTGAAGTGEVVPCCGCAAQGSGPPAPAPPRFGYSPPPALALGSPPLPHGSPWGGDPWWKASGLALLGGTPCAPMPPQGSGMVDWDTMFPPQGSLPPPLPRSPPCPAGLQGSRLAAVRCGGLGPWYGFKHERS